MKWDLYENVEKCMKTISIVMYQKLLYDSNTVFNYRT